MGDQKHCPRWPYLPLCMSRRAGAEQCEGCEERTRATMERTREAAGEVLRELRRMERER